MDDKLKDLIRAALDKTAAGGLQWAGFGSSSFRAKIGSGHLNVLRSVDKWDDDASPDQATVYTVQITDARGRVVAEYEAKIHQDDFKLLDELFRIARRSAFGTDQLIDDMLMTLRGGARS